MRVGVLAFDLAERFTPGFVSLDMDSCLSVTQAGTKEQKYKRPAELPSCPNALLFGRSVQAKRPNREMLTAICEWRHCPS